jgi:hypothetical protein
MSKTDDGFRDRITRAANGGNIDDVTTSQMMKDMLRMHEEAVNEATFWRYSLGLAVIVVALVVAWGVSR